VLKHFSPVKKNAKGTGTMPGIKIKTKLFFFHIYSTEELCMQQNRL